MDPAGTGFVAGSRNDPSPSRIPDGNLLADKGRVGKLLRLDEELVEVDMNDFFHPEYVNITPFP
jgi:hypothetical protein